MLELLERERNERMAHWEMMLTGFGSFMGHNAETIKNTLRPLRKALVEEVFQDGYSVEKLAEYLKTRLEAAKERRRSMERLNGMSVA